jgi:hypothetical protein
LLHVLLGDPERFEFLKKEQVAKSGKVGKEAVTVASFSCLLAMDLVDPMAGVVATMCVASGVAILMASASAVTASTDSSSSAVGGASATAATAATGTTTTVVTPLAMAAL